MPKDDGEPSHTAPGVALPSGPPASAESGLRQDNAALVRELEARTLKLEAANRALQQEIEERRRIEQTLSNILHALPAHVALLDPDGLILSVNEPWRRFGAQNQLQSPNHAVGQNYLRICEETEGSERETAVAVARGIRRVLAGKQAEFSLEYSCHSPEEQRWFRLVATPLTEPGTGGAIVTHVDITQRELDAQRIEQVSRQLETLIAKANIGILLHSDFRPLLANEELARMLGYAGKAEIEGLADCKVIFAAEEQERIVAYNDARLAGREAPAHYAIKGRHRDGSLLDLEIRAFGLQWNGQTAVCAMLADVTEQRKMERQLQQSQRLEAVGQMTGGVAHDFNNLLTVIMGNAELIEDSAPGDGIIRALTEMTRQAAERGAELTGRLLAFSRRQPLDPKATDINRLIANMGTLLRSALGEQIEIGTALAPRLPAAVIDPSQLESALLNLAINARDAMPAGGHLTIETSGVAFDRKAAGDDPEFAPGRYLMIAVSDTGIGMDAGTAMRAFEPFFTTKDVGKGSGLGLSMVYGFVKQSRGQVRIFSEPGHGTTIKIYLPAAQDEAGPAAPEPHETATPRGREKILLVEDDALVRSQVSAQLTALGYRVVSATNGPEAIDTLERVTDFDLLFTDVVMPGGLNGRQVAEAARQRYPTLPVLFTSGYTEDAIVHHGRLDQGVHLLNKPYRRQDLATKIREALGRAG